MASYKAKFEWEQNIKDFAIARDIRDALTTEKITSVPKDVERFVCYMDIIEDFSYETKSNFENMGDQLGGLSSYISRMLGALETFNTLVGLGGNESPFSQYMKLQAWKETEPFRMSFQFNLATKTNPFIDVYAPAMGLLSMSILSMNEKTKAYHTPGVNFKNFNAVKSLKSQSTGQPASTKTNGTKGTSKTATNPDDKSVSPLVEAGDLSASKIIQSFSIITSTIDGISTAGTSTGGGNNPDEIALLVVNGCFIESCKPTWSKERTSSGIPLWCNLDVTIQSIFSANDSMFKIIKPLDLSGTKGLTAGAGAVVATNIFR